MKRAVKMARFTQQWPLPSLLGGLYQKIKHARSIPAVLTGNSDAALCVQPHHRELEVPRLMSLLLFLDLFIKVGDEIMTFGG